MTDNTEFMNALAEKIAERSDQTLENSKGEARSVYAEAREVLLLAEFAKFALKVLPGMQIDTWTMKNQVAYLLEQLAEIYPELSKGG